MPLLNLLNLNKGEVEMRIEKEYLSEKDIEKLGLRSAAALRNDRWSGQNILPFIRVGKNIRYRKTDVLEFLERHTTEAVGQ